MKNKMQRCCLAAVFMLLLILQGTAAGGEKREHRALDSWKPEQGDVIYDGTYPPPQAYPPACRRPGHPGYPPYYCYPPHYRPNIPWYEKELPESAGRLSILVDPVRAKVYVDGYSLERHEDLAYEAGLLSGEYKVIVEAEGYKTHEENVRIRGGERVRLSIRLERTTAGGK